MSSSRPGPPDSVPTLTEVVVLADAAVSEEEDEFLQATTLFEALPAESTLPPAVASEPLITEDQLVQRVLTDLQRQIDLMLEYRLREVLAPTVARAADALIRDARNELASTLHDVVTRAVTQELSRHRGR